MSTSFPKDKLRVVLLENIHESAVNIFESDGVSVERHAASPDKQTLAQIVAEAHIIGLRSKTRLTRDLLAQARRLLAVGCFCIGTDQVDLPAAAAKGVAVFNAPFSNTRSVAELTIAEAIMLTRRVVEKNEQMHRGTWDKSADGAHEIRGRTLGIIGYGHIGTQVSVLAEAMGMRVIFFDIASKLPLGNATSVDSLDQLLSLADIVTVHTPSNQQTHNLINAEAFAKMKPGAMLINNARGTIVDIPALRRAVESGRLGGAALDVFPDEPSGRDDPFRCELRGLRNVILTPHIGGSTLEAQADIGRSVAERLVAFVNTGSTGTAVNVPRVDIPPQTEGIHRVLHFHRNVPGVLGRVNTSLAEAGINVRAQRLETSGEVGYVVLDVDPTHSEAALEQLDSIPETIRLRVLW
jgi:D-3-phosphoglycerate dehydrogenase / 2-oxoglutarate reductase